jgi:phage portal protein BeeE
MASLIGKALAVRDAAPVPMGGTSAGPHAFMLGMGGTGAGDEALMRAYTSNGTVHANVGLIAAAVAAQTWKLFRTAPQDGRRRYTTSDQGSDQRTEVIHHQALSVLAKPASMMLGGYEISFWTRQSLIEISQIWMKTAGRSYLIVEYDPRASFPVGLWPVRPDRITPVPDPRNFLAGWVYTSPSGHEKIPLKPHEVLWNRYPDPLDVYGGAGPIGSVLTDVESAGAAAEWNRNFFLNSAEPGGVLQADHTLTDDEYNELVNRWRETHRGVARAHRIALLEAGVTWVQTHQSMKDMDFGGLRTVSRDIIRESLRMHKVMTGVSDDVNRANAQTGEEVFASWEVSPELRRWRDNVFNAQFLPLFGATGSGVEFDFVDPVPRNREQDNQELKVKAEAALALVTAGYDQAGVLEAVGLPAVKAALTLADQPALPPRWTAPAPPLPPGAPGAASPAGQDAAALAARAARMLNGPDPSAKVFAQQAEDYPAHAMAWMHHATWKGPVKVPLEHIEPDMRYMDGASPEHVQDFVKRLAAGKKVKPVIFVKTPGNPKLQLIDGHHRYLAYAELGQPVRGFIGTTGTDHGDWETMHDYQLDRGAERGAKAQRAREMAVWNSLTGGRR